MKDLKICFVGIGSIAKRHIRNLRELEVDSGVHFCIDALRRSPVSYEGIDSVYTDMEDLPSDYDVIFITNPTNQHLKTLKELHEKADHFFIEKPVVDVKQLSEGENFRLRPGSVYYVACPLRYNAVIHYIKENVKPDEVISVRCISSSYLPEWRPGQDYRQIYSAHKDMGGGVSVDLIHEWDYVTYLFGWPQKVKALIGKKSSLEIDSDDFAIYIAEYDDKILEIHLDYFGRSPVREVQLITKEDTIIGDLLGNKITFLKTGESICFGENRDDYQKRELRHFIDMISENTRVEDGFGHGLKVLKLSQGEA
ncbi:Predicted dehydrogenase [Lachnospiraceae bacterium C10]|nr:Predicted dehydrogenase [Lachnospiraceae bacterium C10]